MWCFQRITRTSWIWKVTNDQVLGNLMEPKKSSIDNTEEKAVIVKLCGCSIINEGIRLASEVPANK